MKSKSDFKLVQIDDYLGVIDSDGEQPFFIDFASKKLTHRRQNASLKNEVIARALGVKPKDQITIIDATAGLGRDSFILASLGFNVVMLERSKIVHALLDNAIVRAYKDPVLQNIVKNLTLVHTDATTWLNNNSAEIVYLDPMFPAKKKSAKVKKEMVFLQKLLGETNDTEILFKTALSCATQRVVVKRSRLSSPIAEQKPSFSYQGKSSRFDIYLTKRN